MAAIAAVFSPAVKWSPYRPALCIAALLLVGGEAAAQADAGTFHVIIKVPDGGVPQAAELADDEGPPIPVIVKVPEPEPEPPPPPKRGEKGKGKKGKKGEGAERGPGDDEGPDLDAGTLDAGDAGVQSAPEPAPPPAKPEAHAATYHGQVSPLVFRVGAGGRSAMERAREATTALESALDHGDSASSEVTVRIEESAAIVRIGPHVITSYYNDDAVAEGLPLPTFAAQVGTELTGFVPTQLTRRAIQLFALHVFLSVFALVVAFVALRELRKLFDRWDESLDEKRGSLTPIAILRIPVISGEALGGALAFGLAVGRIVAYIATVAAAIATVLSQFESTRPLLRRLGKLSTQPIVDGLEAIVGAIPGLALAALIVIGLRAGLRVLHLLLDGVASKQIVWRFLPPTRVPVFRTLAPIAAILLLAPLMIAAAFGQFGTPLEKLALGVTGVVLLASVPLCASWVVGAVLVWSQSLTPGEWIRVGGYSGEVTQVSLGEVRLVPEDGGALAVPSLYLLFHPVHRLRIPPAVSFCLLVERDRPAGEIVKAVQACVSAKEQDAKVAVEDITQATLRVRVSAPALRSGVRETLLLALSDAADAGTFHLAALDDTVRAGTNEGADEGADSTEVG